MRCVGLELSSGATSNIVSPPAARNATSTSQLSTVAGGERRAAAQGERRASIAPPASTPRGARIAVFEDEKLAARQRRGGGKLPRPFRASRSAAPLGADGPGAARKLSPLF